LLEVSSWIPVIVAVISALLAGLFALRTKRAELRAQRLIERSSGGPQSLMLLRRT
jgi:hypothetical protein